VFDADCWLTEQFPTTRVDEQQTASIASSALFTKSREDYKAPPVRKICIYSLTNSTEKEIDTSKQKTLKTKRLILISFLIIKYVAYFFIFSFVQAKNKQNSNSNVYSAS